MAATEKTFYNINRLHVLFAFSAAALLGVTAWMIVADHRRPWREYQRTYRQQIAPWVTRAFVHINENAEFLDREQELVATLEARRAAVPNDALIAQFRAVIEEDAQLRGVDTPDFGRLDTAAEALTAGPSVEGREALLDELRAFVTAAGLRERRAVDRLRARRAEFDEVRSVYEGAVGEGVEESRLETLQRRVDDAAEEIALAESDTETASTHRRRLDQVLGEITHEEDSAREMLADHRAMLERLRRTLAEQQPNVGKQLLDAPLIDALGRPLAIEQIWLPELTLDYNFTRVARFDRCVTCHQGIDMHLRLLGPQHELSVKMRAPPERPEDGQSLKDVYGFALAAEGMLEPSAVTIENVLPDSLAVRARLDVGDVILSVDGKPIDDADALAEMLLKEAEWGQLLRLQIRRGLPHPYAAHPRQDLYAGSLSPHPKAEFGCTVCHDGQGSATDFAWVSHTPNDPEQRSAWRDEHGWFGNPHWDYPMRPKRFAQSSCLQCHHDVTALEPSERFPDPPAADLVAGYHLIRESGCFGCHEIRGVDDRGRRIGPDMRLESNHHEVALRLLADEGLSHKQQENLRRVIEAPGGREARSRLVAVIRAELEADASSAALDLRPMLDLLSAEAPHPGTLAKVGPSLHDVSRRFGVDVLVDKLSDPDHQRADTTMPRLFGLHEHLSERSRTDAQRFEAVELRAAAEALVAIARPVGSSGREGWLGQSAAVPQETVPQETTPQKTDEPPGASLRSATSHPEASHPAAVLERGKQLFELQGCLACHRHADFDQHTPTQGPDLSDSSVKYNGPDAAAWLADWIRDPTALSPRTWMPNVQLESAVSTTTEEEKTDEDADADQSNDSPGEPPIDPAAAIAAYLLTPPEASDETERAPLEIPSLAPLVDDDLGELALAHLSKSYPRTLAEQYLDEGIPAAIADRVPGDAAALIGPTTDENRRQKTLHYVGLRTIRKRGCYGCHDVPGFETDGPIGPALADWGRKQPSLLAFEQINRYVHEETPDEGDTRRAYFLAALRKHQREGFLWQKLRAPRSFDYEKAHNRPFNEWLTMARFDFDDRQIEQIATFVLGLVAEPPTARYVDSEPDPRHLALVEGRRLFEQHACTTCHLMELPRWTVDFDIQQPEGFFEDLNLPYAVEDFEFLDGTLSEDDVADIEDTWDEGGRFQVELTGMPRLDAKGNLRADEYEDYDGNLFEFYTFSLWQPASLGGHRWAVPGKSRYVLVPDGQLDNYRLDMQPSVGGEFARLVYPAALAEVRRVGAVINADAGEQAWGWLPPVLIGEGAKVRLAWLADYLANPREIRPAAVLRMPKYRFTPSEASHLAVYLASITGGGDPDLDPKDEDTGYADPPSPEETARQQSMDAAMKLIRQKQLDCASCHRIGSYSPGEGIKSTLGPNLVNAGPRLRADYLRRWIANPKAVLPYTRMTPGFHPTGEAPGQDVFPGTGLEQLDAVRDLLLHYDWYMSWTASRELIESADAAPAGGSPSPEQPGPLESN